MFERLFKTKEKTNIQNQPVEGGYLIVTAWGDESKDPELS